MMTELGRGRGERREKKRARGSVMNDERPKMGQKAKGPNEAVNCPR